MSGKKRSSPGADVEKNPLESVELGDEDAKKLQSVQKDIARAELVLERHAQMTLIPVYEKRRAVTKTIPKFWPIALMNNQLFSLHAQHNGDQVALSYLEDLWVVRDPKEPRCYVIEFHFKENPFFSDRVLKKEFTYLPPPAAANEEADENGVTETMLEFSWERDVQSSATKINWKEASKALTHLHPRAPPDEDDDMSPDSGSFFNFFEHAADPFEIGLTIANEIYPEAIDYFLGNVDASDIDSDSDDDESDDEAEEIDLEKPKTKKQKRG